MLWLADGGKYDAVAVLSPSQRAGMSRMMNCSHICYMELMLRPICQHQYHSAKLDLPSPPSRLLSHTSEVCLSNPQYFFPCIASNPQAHTHTCVSNCVNSQPCRLSLATKYSLCIQRVNTLIQVSFIFVCWLNNFPLDTE